MTKKALNWLGYLAIIAAILFFLAPESWWQFGVSPAAKRSAASDFEMKTLAGNEWNIADFQGKVVVINYWATWCGPCRVEMPGLVSFADQFKDKGVEIIGVTMDEDVSVVPAFMQEYSINYPIALPNYDAVPAAEGFPLPTTMLYDKEGRLAKKYTGIVLESTLRSDTKILLAE